jgi:hypothetical protein
VSNPPPCYVLQAPRPRAVRHCCIPPVPRTACTGRRCSQRGSPLAAPCHLQRSPVRRACPQGHTPACPGPQQVAAVWSCLPTSALRAGEPRVGGARACCAVRLPLPGQRCCIAATLARLSSNSLPAPFTCGRGLPYMTEAAGGADMRAGGAAGATVTGVPGTVRGAGVPSEGPPPCVQHAGSVGAQGFVCRACRCNLTPRLWEGFNAALGAGLAALGNSKGRSSGRRWVMSQGT